MPFLKPLKDSVIKEKIKTTERNGLRHAIFSSRKSKYIGEWFQDKRNGKGTELTRF